MQLDMMLIKSIRARLDALKWYVLNEFYRTNACSRMGVVYPPGSKNTLNRVMR